MTNTTRTIDGRMYSEFVKHGTDSLGTRRSEINDLNVFPIPDGDTGDNMYMTISAGANLTDVESVSAAAKEISRRMLYGARGNSGVILSRIFYGIAEGLSDIDTAGVAEMKSAMRVAVREAYSAVDTPVEGTMLTVFRDGVDAAESCGDSSTLNDYFAAFLGAMRDSLTHTPEKLRVLRDAGVIDSGGAGLVAIAEGILTEGGVKADESENNSGSAAIPDFSLFGSDSVLEYGYCTEFLLRLQSSKTDTDSFDEKELARGLAEFGDSIVSFKDGSIVKVHIHTFVPGKVLSFCQQYGEFLTLKIENMTLQHNGKLKSSDTPDSGIKPAVRKKYGIVAAASGDGMKKMFTELGADIVIDGGQCTNPSAEDFIRAFGDVYSENILVFPNNGNIIMAAEQAAALWKESKVTVIKSKNIGEGYIALSGLDTSVGTAEEIEASLCDEMSRVCTGMISRASKNGEFDGISVKSGDYIGFSDHRIYSAENSPYAAAEKLIDEIGGGDFGVCIIVAGSDADSDETRKIAEYAESSFPIEVIVTDGGQPLYDYIIIFD